MIRRIKCYAKISSYGKVWYNDTLNACLTFRFNRYFSDYKFIHPMMNTPRRYKKLKEGELV